VDGQVRELRCHYGRSLYRVLYRRSGTFLILLHSLSKTKTETQTPIGRTHAQARKRRTKSAAYQAELARLAPYEALARNLIGYRMEHGLTQAQLAKRVGTSHSAISRIESGQHAATPETLRKLATALDRRLVIGFERGPKKTPERDLVVFG